MKFVYIILNYQYLNNGKNAQEHLIYLGILYMANLKKPEKPRQKKTVRNPLKPRSFAFRRTPQSLCQNLKI